MLSRRIMLSMLPLALLSGCFTGIESTPKISDKDLRREQIPAKNEDYILSDISPQPFGEWTSGKQFYVTDTKLEMALEPSSEAVPPAESIINYCRWRPVPSVAGTDDIELLFSTPSSDTLIYRLNIPYDELIRRRRVEIPFTIEMSVVDSVRKRLIGKDLFIRTTTWYDTKGNNTISGLKYVPVHITDVVPGNLVYPVRIAFQPDTISGVPVASIYMAIDNNIKGSRSFSALFSIDNPRNNYPNITDETWNNIIRGRINKFMTREECRLALGSPKTVRRRNALTSIQEMWTYDNGVYLIFEDEILTSFRQ